MKNTTTYYIHYQNVPDVRELIKLIREATSEENQIVRNQLSLYNLKPNISLHFTDENLQIIYSKGSIGTNTNTCKDVSVSLDYDDFESSELFGRTIRDLLDGGLLSLHFPNSPRSVLEFNYDFGENTLKIGICHPLPF
jgi:hypothetical protein